MGPFSTYNLPGSGLPLQVNYGVSSLTLSATSQLVPVVNLISPHQQLQLSIPRHHHAGRHGHQFGRRHHQRDFLRGTNLLGGGTNSPFSLTWSNVPPGSYLITATATDTTGATGGSSAKNIIVLPVAAGTNFTWVAGSGNWSTPGNWSPAGVPGAFDEANILNGATVTLTANTTIGFLNFGAGTLNGSLLTVSNTCYWTGGILNCPVTIPTNSLLIIAGGAGVNNMPSIVLTNYGTVEWASGTIHGGYYGTTIDNYGLWDAQSDQTFNDNYGYAGLVFNNYGTFRKSGG